MRRLAYAVFGALMLSAAPAHAATFQVNTTQDLSAGCTAVACSLRGALSGALINGAVEDDVINLPAGTYAITQDFTLNGNTASRITINGAGANTTFVQPTNPTRVFNLTGGAGITLRGMTVRGGRPPTGFGGNISVSSSVLTLDGVRVTDGQAAGGGGIYVVGGSPPVGLTITRSLIDTNTATGGNNGGGIFMPGQTQPFSASITDSTIAYNTATAAGGGIAIQNNLAPTLRGVTVAFNTGTTGTGGILSANTAATIQGSIFTGNRGVSNALDNCQFSGAVTDQGGNVDNLNDCGLASPTSLRNTNAQLATAFDASQPQALAVTPGSPAVDFADCGGRTLDQRSVPRPQGALCDAGAYEFKSVPDTSIAGAAPPFTFSSSDAAATFECSLDGSAFTACASPFDPGAGPGQHTLAVRAVDQIGQADASPATATFSVAAPPTATPTPPVSTPTPTVTPTPTPVVDQTIVVGPARGTVKVKRPGSNRYEDLDVTKGIPVGSTVDTRKGRVTLTAIPKAGAPAETAVFFDGLFKVTQSRGITNLTLTEPLAACPKNGRASGAAAAAKKKSRKLWGDGKGSFRTTGRHSAATVRGTRWLVQDSCAGTLTRVTQGSVTVRDRGRTIIVRAGKRYLAKPR